MAKISIQQKRRFEQVSKIVKKTLLMPITLTIALSAPRIDPSTSGYLFHIPYIYRQNKKFYFSNVLFTKIFVQHDTQMTHQCLIKKSLSFFFKKRNNRIYFFVTRCHDDSNARNQISGLLTNLDRLTIQFQQKLRIFFFFVTFADRLLRRHLIVPQI